MHENEIKEENIILKFKDFEEAITKIQKHYKKFDDLSDVTNKAIDLYEYFGENDGADVAIHLLENIMRDEKNKWITYWMFDLNWGTEYKDGCVTIDGKNIELRTVRDLYDLLWDNCQCE